MAQTEVDWDAWSGWEDWQIVAFERVSPDHVVAVQFYPRGQRCIFIGETVPEHKKRDWERELDRELEYA